MVLGYSNGTTCIRSDNLDLIELALTRILKMEGCRRIPQPPLPQNPLPVMKTLRSLPWEITPYLWVFSLFVGNLGWTIIKTSPIELLCQRAKGAIRPRLSELAMQTGCDAFHHSVHDRTWGALLEADASGQTFAGGDLDCYDVEKMRFYDEPITERTGGPHFFLLNVPEELRAAGRVRINYKERQRRRKELEALFQRGEQPINAQSELEELDKGHFEIADEVLGQALINPSHFWDYWYEVNNLLYKAYAEPQQLEADGARLLYFQPTKKPNVREIWEAISNGTDTDTDIDDIPFMRPVYSRTTWANQLCDSWELEANRPWEGVKQFKL